MFGKTHLDMGTGHIYVRPTWFSLFGVLTILFGGFNPSDKYESQLGLLFSIYGKMFQTTNQHLIILSLSLSRSLSLSLTPSLPPSLSLSLSLHRLQIRYGIIGLCNFDPYPYAKRKPDNHFLMW